MSRDPGREAGSYAVSVRRFGADKVTAFASMRRYYGDPDLTGLRELYGHIVV